MALSLTHSTVVATPDDGTSDVGTNEWNAEHTITMATSKVLGRTTAGGGAVEELGITGSGSVVFSTSPTLVTPVLGTPSSGTLTSCTGPVKRFAEVYFYPQDNEPPATSYATLDTRNAHPVLDFDDTAAESAVWTGVLPATYNGGGITVAVAYSCTSATTGTVGFTVAIERIGDSQQDVDADSFATAQTITAVTVPGTSGFVDVINVAITNGANMD